MNPVIKTIREHIANNDIRFVFPSQVASDQWAQKTCSLGIVRSVAKKRFIAWDDFKIEVIKENVENREPVTSEMRRLFSDSLVRRNSEEVFFKSVIPPLYAKGGAVFVSFISRLLPSLAYWEKLVNESNVAVDTEDEDFKIIKNEYSAFLNRYNLFEPAWEEIKMAKLEFRYVIFFPELIEDFAEYDALLKGPQFIRIGAETVSDGACECVLFNSAREEIRSAVMELERIHDEEGVPYEDMAVSVPELEKMEPYLTREFNLRHIPFVRRAGKKLGEKGAGRLFLLVNECASSQFSFNSLKALLLNDHIPWNEKDKNLSLIRFGIKYNCVSSYVQDGKNIDIWEEAFNQAYKNDGRELQTYYRELKRHILSLAGAKSFSDIQKYYFAFRGEASRQGLLDMGKISEEDNAVLGRCIKELNFLIELEEKLNDPTFVPASPLAFFINCLEEIEYVRADQGRGINIYEWRVASASPFRCHFVLNASQSASSVLYQPMKFLRQDKRKALALDDSDATGAFFKLYNTGEDNPYKCRSRISASTLSFSGWAIPHSFFSQSKIIKALTASTSKEDSYREERRFWKERQFDSTDAGFQKIYYFQKSSFDIWKNTLIQKDNDFSFFYSPVNANHIKELLLKTILDKDGYLNVTATKDLNVYYACSLFWLYARVFEAEKFSLEVMLLDDTSLGLVYHKILEKLFTKIKNDDDIFQSRHLDTYKKWLPEITREHIKNESAFRGPLAVPLVSPQAAGMSKKIAAILDLEAKFYDGYRVAELELPVTFKTEELFIKGIIDRVSVSPEGEILIIDYKTSDLPDQTKIEDLKEHPLSEFQMPLYVKLFEEKSNANTISSTCVNQAVFYSINKRKIKNEIGDHTRKRAKAHSRKDYEVILEAADKQIEEFKQKVKSLDFIPSDINIKKCQGCIYKTVCRTTFFLNSDRSFFKAKMIQSDQTKGDFE